MPSKKKKPSKPSAAPPSSGLSPSTVTPSRSVGRGEEDEETQLRRLLSAAAAKFPEFISEDAFIGSVANVDSSSQNRGGEARIWVSEAAMVSSSLRPGCLVSVSLAASDGRCWGNVPLDSFSDGIAGSYEFERVIGELNGLGNYFAIAMAFPSRKVLKNEVRLSHCLSCTMGFPSTGKSIYLCPIQTVTEHSYVNKKMDNSTNTDVCKAFLRKCSDLYLKFVPPSASLIGDSKGINSGVSIEPNHTVRIKESSLSPRTPLSYQQKASSTSHGPVSSSRYKGMISKPDTIFVLSTIRMALEDKQVNSMQAIYAGRWLCGRYLLKGSIVSFPILGNHCMFVVESANQKLADGSSYISAFQGESFQSTYKTQFSGSLEPVNAVFIVDNKTNISLFESMPSNLMYSMKEDLHSEEHFDKSRLEALPKLGGLSKEVSILREIIKFSLAGIDSLPRYKGVLLHGPPGTGKTSLASFCAHDAGANFFSINGPEVVSQYYGESEQALCKLFSSARRAAPAVVFIDELDAIAPARKDGGEELSLRMVATLLSLMDSITETDAVLLIAATNRPDSIDPALRRPGRLDREIEIGVPSPNQRLEILSTVLNEMHHSLSCSEIQSLSFATHGFVGADLVSLCNEAAIFALRRFIAAKELSRLQINQHSMDQVSQSSGRSVFSQDCILDAISLSVSKIALSPTYLSSLENGLENNSSLVMSYPENPNTLEDSTLRVNFEDFEKAKLKVRPSAMREVMLELPKVCWEDVGGQTEIKRQLIEAVQWPQMNPDAFRRVGIRPPRGLLLFGPPGCSKTLMARAVASEAKLNFLAVKGPELLSKWVGESEKAVRSLFAKARANSPSIIFFDEIDGLAIIRGHDSDGTSVADRVLSQLLVELDGLDHKAGVTVIAATNRPDKIDPALLRPGRFDRHLDVKPPDASDREAIFRIHMRGMPCGDVTAKNVARLTEGYTGADIKLICREAAIAALEETFEASEISMEHFKIAIERVQPTDTSFYTEISDNFRRYVDSRGAKDQ